MKIHVLLYSALLLLFSRNYAQTVTIGTQVWTTKNLDVKTFRNGEAIPQAKTDEEWVAAGNNEQAAWCYYDNDAANGTKYGILYNWYAVNDPRGLAPAGYHIPSDAEWTILSDFLGGEVGNKMKSLPIYETKVTYVEDGGYNETKYIPCANCSYWTEKQKANNPCSACRNTGGKIVSTGKYIPKTKRKVEEKKIVGGWDGDNSSGFSGLPGGDRSNYGSFYSIGYDGDWWSSTEDDSGSAFYRSMDNPSDYLTRDRSREERGCSVRCLEGEFVPQSDASVLDESEFEEVVPPFDAFVLDVREPVESFVEEEADFPGGYDAMKIYIEDNLDYPQEAIDLGIKGRVTLRFVVEKDGRISNISVQSPLAGCKDCDEAAVKVVEKMPSWSPGKNGGRAVRTWVTLPIKFEVVDVKPKKR